MMLAATTVENAESFIMRGIKSDDSQPRGDVYLLQTSDNSRSVRKIFYPMIKDAFEPQHTVNIVLSDGIVDRSNILLFYWHKISASSRDLKLLTWRNSGSFNFSWRAVNGFDANECDTLVGGGCNGQPMALR